MFNLYTNVVPVNEHTETGIYRRVCVCVFFSRKSGPSNKSHRGTIIKTGDTVVQKPKRAFRIQRENTLNELSADAKRRIVRQSHCLVRIRYTRISRSVRLRAFLGPIRQANTVFKQRSQHVLTTFFTITNDSFFKQILHTPKIGIIVNRNRKNGSVTKIFWNYRRNNAVSRALFSPNVSTTAANLCVDNFIRKIIRG